MHVVYENGKSQCNDDVGKIMANNVAHENPSTGKHENIAHDRDAEQFAESELIITDSSCNTELNSATCHCSELAVQVKRIESKAI